MGKKKCCGLVKQKFHISNPKKYTKIIAKPKFYCENCGRAARKEVFLCKPTELVSKDK